MTDYSAANQRLQGYIATYLAIPVSKRTPRQSAALATDQATLARQSGGGSTTATPAQLMTPTSAGPVGSPMAGASVASGLGSISPNVLLLGGAAIVVLLLLRRK